MDEAQVWAWGPIVTQAGLGARFWQRWPVYKGSGFFVHDGHVWTEATPHRAVGIAYGICGTEGDADTKLCEYRAARAIMEL